MPYATLTPEQLTDYNRLAQIQSRARKRADGKRVFARLKTIECNARMLSGQLKELADWCHQISEQGNLK